MWGMLWTTCKSDVHVLHVKGRWGPSALLRVLTFHQFHWKEGGRDRQCWPSSHNHKVGLSWAQCRTGGWPRLCSWHRPCFCSWPDTLGKCMQPFYFRVYQGIQNPLHGSLCCHWLPKLEISLGASWICGHETWKRMQGREGCGPFPTHTIS